MMLMDDAEGLQVRGIQGQPPASTLVDSKDLYPDEARKYPPVTAGEYLKERLAQIYGKEP